MVVGDEVSAVPSPAASDESANGLQCTVDQPA